MSNFLTFVLCVFGVLQIILFFKIWGMTNDTKKIKDMLNMRNRLIPFHGNLPSKCKDYQGNIYFVTGIYEDKILCVQNKDDDYVIELNANEVSLIED
jgi:hypothetical protein